MFFLLQNQNPFFSSSGVFNDNKLICNGISGALLYGPYYSILSGVYKFRVFFDDITNISNLFFDIVSSEGKEVIFSKRPVVEMDKIVFNNKFIFTVEVAVLEEKKSFEFRLHSSVDTLCSIVAFEIIDSKYDFYFDICMNLHEKLCISSGM